MAGGVNEITSLSMDMIDLGGVKLPDNLEFVTDLDSEDQVLSNIEEGKNITNVTDGISQEIVGDESTGEASDAGNTDKDSTTSPADNVFKNFASFLAERGLLTFDEKEIEKVKDDDSFADLVKNQIKANEYADLTDNQKKYLEALREGIPEAVIHDNLTALETFQNITDEVIRGNADVRKELIIEGFLAQGFDKEYALRQFRRVSDANEDVEEAIMFRNKLAQLKDQQYQQEVENVRKQKETAELQAAKQLEDLKTSVYSVEKLFGELTVNKTMQDRVYSLMTKPVTKLENGVPINALQKHQLENPVDFQSKLYWLYDITDGFKNINRIVTRAQTKVVNSFKAKLEKSNFVNTSQSNPTFHEDAVDRPVITDIID